MQSWHEIVTTVYVVRAPSGLGKAVSFMSKLFRSKLKIVVVTSVSVLVDGALSPASAAAQIRGLSTTMELGGRRLAVSPDEMIVLSELGRLVGSGQTSAQDRALERARRVVNGLDARHALATYELELGTRRRDDALRAKALEVLIASNASPDRLPGYLATRGQIAFNVGDLMVAETFWSRLAVLSPANSDVLASLAQVRVAQKNFKGAERLLARAGALTRDAGGIPSEVWIRQRLSLAQQGRLLPAAVVAARELVTTYPSAENWRAALEVYRDLAMPSGSREIDLLRLMRQAGAFTRSAHYQRTAQLLERAGQIEEAKAVLREGVARGLLDPATSPTREIIATLERKGGATSAADVAGEGRGRSLVQAGVEHFRVGRKAEAESTFRAAISQGSEFYADLAFFWLSLVRQSA